MSRNFELLQRLGEQQGLFQSTQPSPVSSPPRPRDEGEHPVEITNAPVGHDPEINRLVQRLFFPANEFSSMAAVSFCAVETAGMVTNVCARVAELLAQSSESVCVVDANFYASTLHYHFGIPNDRGLSDSLTAADPIESFGQRLPSGLTVFPAGSVAVGKLSATISNAMISRVSELRARFDYVLIQSPSLTSLSQASLLGRLSDGVVLIVEANMTRRDLASKLKRELQQNNVMVLGAVLNNRTFPIPQKLYSKLF
jgi:Mrp family chromosome partitioning ATPase